MPTNVNELIAYIQQYIYANGQGLITGPRLAAVLVAIVTYFGTYYAPLSSPSFTGTVTMTTPLAATSGGTGANTPAGARSGLSVGNFATPQDYGCVENGVADCAAATNAAASVVGVGGVSANVYLRSGNYLLNSAVGLNGQCLYGDGRQNTTINVSSTFDPAALGVITLTGREQQSPCVNEISFVFAQPADNVTSLTAGATAGASTITVASTAGIINPGSSVYDYTTAGIKSGSKVTAVSGNVVTIAPALSANVNSGDVIDFGISRNTVKTLAAGCSVAQGGSGCIYPDAIHNISANRIKLHDLSFYAATSCINLPNSGGWVIRDVECGAFNTGLAFDNGLDFCFLTNWHGWNFGESGNLYNGYYADGFTVAGSWGECDGITISGWSTFNAILNVLPTWSWGTINGFNVDGPNGQVNWAGGKGGNFTLISNGYSLPLTPGGPNPVSGVSSLFNMTSGRVYWVNPFLIGNNQTNNDPAVKVTGGDLALVNGRIGSETAGAPAALVSGTGGLTIRGTEIGTHASTRTAALISQTDTGTLNMSDIIFFGAPGGSPVGVSIGAYNSVSSINSIVWNGFVLNQPGGVLGATNGSIFYGTPGSYTYYPTPGATSLTITLCGAGGGGGGGALVASGTAASGGAGGGGGYCQPPQTFATGTFGTSGVAVTVGAGGTAGAAATTNSTAGGNGSAGGSSSFGSNIVVGGGGGGAGGQVAGGSGGGGGGGPFSGGGNSSNGTGGAAGQCAAAGGSATQATTVQVGGCGGGGSGSTATGQAFIGGWSFQGGPGGASGGGVSAALASNNGGAGRCPSGYYTASAAAGTSGTPNGANGVTLFSFQPACSGGGGYGNASGVAGSAGASGPVAGGSGGGSALNGSTAGAGAAGGNGFVSIVENRT